MPPKRKRVGPAQDALHGLVEMFEEGAYEQDDSWVCIDPA